MQQLKILKPKTRPTQIEPWFFRYLNEGQLKVVSAILTHADIKDRQSKSFPSNKTIAFYCGFGLIQEGTKSFEKYSLLSSDEKKAFMQKRLKNAIVTVKNIKRELERIGLLQKKVVGKTGRQIVYYTLDLEWKKEEFLSDFDQQFNGVDSVAPGDDENIETATELENIANLIKENKISKTNLAKRLKDVSFKVAANNFEDTFIPIEDINKLSSFIINTNKYQEKIDKGEIADSKAYESSIRKMIKNNTFNGVSDYYKGLENKHLKELLDTLKHSLIENENEAIYQRKTLYFNSVRLDNNLFVATYQTKDKSFSKEYILSSDRIKFYLVEPPYFVKKYRELLEKYDENLKNLTQVKKE